VLAILPFARGLRVFFGHAVMDESLMLAPPSAGLSTLPVQLRDQATVTLDDDAMNVGVTQITPVRVDQSVAASRLSIRRRCSPALRKSLPLLEPASRGNKPAPAAQRRAIRGAF